MTTCKEIIKKENNDRNLENLRTMDKITNKIDSQKTSHNRIHLTLSEKSMESLEELRENLEASTISEAIRRSILLSISITNAIKNGGRIVIERNDGTRDAILIS